MLKLAALFDLLSAKKWMRGQSWEVRAPNEERSIDFGVYLVRVNVTEWARKTAGRSCGERVALKWRRNNNQRHLMWYWVRPPPLPAPALKALLLLLFLKHFFSSKSALLYSGSQRKNAATLLENFVPFFQNSSRFRPDRCLDILNSDPTTQKTEFQQKMKKIK